MVIAASPETGTYDERNHADRHTGFATAFPISIARHGATVSASAP